MHHRCPAPHNERSRVFSSWISDYKELENLIQKCKRVNIGTLNQIAIYHRHQWVKTHVYTFGHECPSRLTSAFKLDTEY